MGNLKDKYAIVGIGETKFGKLPHMSSLALNLEASKKAIENAGLATSDIDGVISQSPYSEPNFMISLLIAQYLGISPLRYSATLDVGGAAPIIMAQHAAMAIEAGMCKAVICTFGENGRTVNPSYLIGRLKFGGEEFQLPYGAYGAPVGYAIAARRHMHEYGTTSEQLGWIAVITRKHACMNPSAALREPITIEDHQNSRWVVEPLRILDCCLVSDAGGAYVVTSAERAKDLWHHPIYIMGMGQAHPHKDHIEAATLTTMGAKLSGETAFKMAGITVKNVDVAEIYDCFTYTTLISLEGYGFCKIGEGGPYVEGGKRIEIGGDGVPVNTHGGLLSQAYLGGMLHITEAVMQLRGDAGERQVKDARIALVSGNGGILASHSTLILRK